MGTRFHVAYNPRNRKFNFAFVGWICITYISTPTDPDSLMQQGMDKMVPRNSSRWGSEYYCWVRSTLRWMTALSSIKRFFFIVLLFFFYSFFFFIFYFLLLFIIVNFQCRSIGRGSFCVLDTSIVVSHDDTDHHCKTYSFSLEIIINAIIMK